MRRKIIAIVTVPFALGLTIVAAPSASAAPISCPDGQSVTKTSSGWDCVNNGGNTSNAEDPKNPNVKKGFF